MLLLIQLVSAAAAGASSASDLACSLNGQLVGGKCACDLPWKGNNCAKLDIKPKKKGALPAYGFAPNVTSWGGNAIQNDAGTFDLWVSEMVGGCGLNSWVSHSRIVHATAPDMDTPFKFADESLPVWAHNAAPVRAPKTHAACPGCYFLFHIGSGETTRPPAACGPDGNVIAAAEPAASCTTFVAHHGRIGPHSEQEKKIELACSSTAACPAEAAAACGAASNCSSFGISSEWMDGRKAQLYSSRSTSGIPADSCWTLYSCRGDGAASPGPPAPPPRGPCVGMCGNSSSLVHYSRTPAGPWLPLPSIPGQSCNNPAPAFAKNGTLYVLCSSSSIWRSCSAFRRCSSSCSRCCSSKACCSRSCWSSAACLIVASAINISCSRKASWFSLSRSRAVICSSCASSLIFSSSFRSCSRSFWIEASSMASCACEAGKDGLLVA